MPRSQSRSNRHPHPRQHPRRNRVGHGPRDARPPLRIEVVVGSGEKGERTLPAQVFGADAENDLALLRVTAKDLPDPLTFGEAEKLIETQEVVIFGYPFGELLGKNISVNRSTVSSLRKEKGALVVVQMAGGLNPGNSGGPVTNARGEVVGVSVAKLRGTDTIAFAIPAEVAAEFVKEQFRVGGRIVGPSVASRPAAVPPPKPAMKSEPPPRVPPGPAKTAPPKTPPAKSAPVTPAPPAVAGTEIKLPAEATEVCVGGGGRFLILSLPKVKQIAVFDANTAKVVKYLPAPADKVLLAAGMDKLMVVDPHRGIVQRWSLATFEKEVTAPLPTTAGLTTTAIVMGSASNGPLLVQGLDYPRLGEWYTLDITTMKEREGPARHNSGLECGQQDRARASNDGRTVVVTRGRGGASILTLPADGPAWAVAHTPWQERASSFPSSDGGTVYGVGEICTPGGKRLTQAAGGSVHYVPAVHGPLVLAITDLVDRHDTNRGFRLAVHAPRDTRPMFQLPTFEAIRSLFVPNQGWLTDGHVFFIPRAKVVAVLPRVADKLVLYKVDVDAELAKPGLDYLFVASHPPAVAPGKRYEYPIEAKAKKGGVKFKLDFAPDGMAVDADGKVTWDAPADFTAPAAAAVTITDATGQEVVHTFDLVPAAK